ncbi:MAG: SulP family inorganic anion transporter [Sphingobacteriaceae bacterium]|nr:SulP family inorganic anion transporter [Sphingobacteriaceae bacterium]
MFKPSTLKYDIKAGLVVFLVALPLCLGIALAQGAPLFSGIISGIIGGIVVAAISGSKLSVSGPAAGLTSIVLAAVTSLGSFEAFLLSVSIAGVIQITLGVLKAGIIGYYFPTAVIKGMLSAIGIVLIMTQIPHFLGDDKNPMTDEVLFHVDNRSGFSKIFKTFDSPNVGSVLIGVVSLFILVAWEWKIIKRNKILSQIPSALLVVVVAIVIDLLFSNFFPGIEVKEEHLVKLPMFSGPQDFFSSLLHPDFSAWRNSKIYEIAIVIAVVASLETLLSIEAVDKLDPDHQVSPTNRELIAQGVGNLFSGLVGGLPITSVIVRSSANVNAGGKTQMASIIHGVFFLVAIFILPSILQLIPLSALAAVLIMTGYKLARPGLFKSMYRQGLDQFLPFIITILVMLFTDLLKGVTVGILVAIFFILKQNYKLPFKIIKEKIDGRWNYFIKLSQNVTFINKGKFIELFKSIPAGAKVHIDGGRSTFIDKDILEIISGFKQSGHIHRITVVLEEIEEVKVLSNH